MKSINFIIFISILLTGCFAKTNVCSSSIQPTIELQDFQKLTENDKALLHTLDKNGRSINSFKLEYIIDFDGYTVIYFDDSNALVPNHTYKMQYNNDVYFVYGIELANNTRHRYCDEETTYHVNNCESTGQSLTFNPTCAIPADQADRYFEKKIKPTME